VVILLQCTITELIVLFVDIGQVPFNIMGPSSSSSAVVSGVNNCPTVEQLQLMSQLAQQHQQRPVYAPGLEAVLGHGHGQGQLLAGYIHQPPPPQLSAINSTTVRPQPHLRGTTSFI